jgi:hypothetical protein
MPARPARPLRANARKKKAPGYGAHAHLLATRPKGDEGVLRASASHRQRLQHQLAVKMIVHRATRHPTIEGINHHGQIRKIPPNSGCT